MESLSPKYVFPVEGIAFADGPLPVAGIFLLEGRSHVAPLHSLAERRLVAAGALRIATLRFDPDPLERTHADRPVRALDAVEAARHYQRLADEN